MVPLLLLLLGGCTSSPLDPGQGGRCGYESCTQAQKDVLNVHIVPHTHDDVGWLKTVDQYYYGSRSDIQKAGVQYILDTVVKELWEDPKRRFMYVETAFFWKWWTRQSDDIQHKVRTLVKQGRLQFVGGAWSMNDEAATHYQSTIDQFTWGLRKLNETFGECGLPRVGWQIDPFGHSREFSSLLAGMGYDGLFLGRIDYQDKDTRLREKNMEMVWRGDDDLGEASDLFTGVLYNTYSPPRGFCFDVLCNDEPIIDDVSSPDYNVDRRVSGFMEVVTKMAARYRTNSILVTMGDDFNYQDAVTWFRNLDKLIDPLGSDAHTLGWRVGERGAKILALMTPLPVNSLFYIRAIDRTQIGHFVNEIAYLEAVYRTNNVLFTMGGDFTYQDAAMWYTNLDKLIEYTNMKSAKEGLNVKLFYSTPDCYLKAVKDANPTLPTKQDDFFPYASDGHSYWTGYFTSRPTVKYFERQGNNYLQMVKQLQVVAGLEEHNSFVIDELRSAMGVMQHHDAVTGTEKQHVTHDYERLLDQAIEDSLLVARQAFSKFIQADNNASPLFEFDRCRFNQSECETSETSDNFMVTIYNPLAWKLDAVPVYVPVVDAEYHAYAPNGDRIESELIPISEFEQKIPTRQSKATKNLLFIAKNVKAMGYKNFYVKKLAKLQKRDTQSVPSNGNKRQNDFYENVNEYWKQIKEQNYVDIKNIEDSTAAAEGSKINQVIDDEIKPKFENEVVSKKVFVNTDNEKYMDPTLDILKDNKADPTSSVIEELEKMLKESRESLIHKIKEDKVREDVRRSKLPSLNEEEMRMLGDDPRVVEANPEDCFVENKHTKLRINNITGEITHIILNNGQEIPFKYQIGYYPGCYGNNSEALFRASGAYIFRPNASEPIAFPYAKGNIFKSSLLEQVEYKISDDASVIFRVVELGNNVPYIEVRGVINPISVEDETGKEIVIRYQTDIVNNGEFFTDSNGRQMLKRKLGQRPQWNLTLKEPVAGNYYPITNRIYIKDAKKRLTILTDRSQGGWSPREGVVELMVHRRLLHDDAFGVGEALNETAMGKGLAITFTHRIFVNAENDKQTYINEKKAVLENHLSPITFVSDAKDVTYNQWLQLKNCHEGINDLPVGLHLLTLEPWDHGKLLLRFENYLEKSDRDDASIEIDVSKLFTTFTVKYLKETTLAANQWLEDKEKWTWNKEDAFDKSFNHAYGNFNANEKADNIEIGNEIQGFKIKLEAKQIRTFIVDYIMKTV